VQRLHRDRQGCAGQLGIERLSLHIIGADADDQAIVHLGRRCVAGAFENLAGIPGWCRRNAVVHRQCDPGRRVGATSGKNHLRTSVQGCPMRLRTHHADDAFIAVDQFGRQCDGGAQRAGAAGSKPAFDETLVLLGVDQRHLEMQIVLARDLPHDVRAGL